MDRLKTLEIFQAVADKGSFVRAADTLALSTAVVTRAVQDLERRLGVRLLQRSTRRVSLTLDGEDVLARTRQLLESFDELTASSSLGASEIAGDIRFSTPASFSSRLAPALAAFTAQHPKVRLQLLASDAPPDLVGERIDLALRIARRLPDTLIARRIGDVRMAVYGAPSYLARRGLPKHPDELAAHDCLVYGITGRDATWPFHHPVTQQPVEPPVRGLLWANNAEALMTAAINGSGLVLLPQFVAADAVARGELQQVLNHWAAPPLGMFLAYTSRRNQPLRVRKLIDHLVEALAALANDPAPPPIDPRQRRSSVTCTTADAADLLVHIQQ